jgi:CPA2 family monovalent cation:H+ antiporter-2
MLLNLGFLVTTSALIFLLVAIVLVLKAFIAGGAALAIGRSIRTSTQTGLALCNIGEFAFILLVAGEGLGFLSVSGTQVFLAVAVITISLTPFAIALGPSIVESFCRLPLPDSVKRGCVPPQQNTLPPLRDHVVIVGYGLNGRNLSRAARASKIPYVIIDLNPDTVTKERAHGEPIFFGDATNATILEHAHLLEARVMVVVINDPLSTRAITRIARQINPGLFIITRTRFTSELEPLRKLGADEVIPEEFETSVEIFTRVLRKYLIPREQIDALVREMRSGAYQMFRDLSVRSASLQDLNLNIPDAEISTHLLAPESPFTGNSLAALNVRKNYGVSVLAIQRGDEVISNPGGEMVLEPGDRLIIIGKADEISRISRLLSGDETIREKEES